MLSVVLVSLALTACGQGKPVPGAGAAPASNVMPPAPAPTAVDLLTAFKAAFGAPAPASVEVPNSAGQDPTNAQVDAAAGTSDAGTTTLQFSPAKLFQLSPGLFVLISKGVDPVGCHACGGILSVDYLRRTAGGFDVLSRGGFIGPRAGYGAAPDFSIRSDLFQYAALQVQAEDDGQGCSATGARLYELAPSGVAARGDSIVLAGSYDGSVGQKAFNYSGTIVPDVRIETDTAYNGAESPPHPVHAFKVVYQGSAKGEVEYRPDGTPLGSLTLPHC